MRKTILALAAAATVGAGIAAPQPAEARNRGGAVAAGVIGGVAAGALIGGAIASRPAYGYYGPSYGYYGAGYYDAGPPCRIVRERIWDGFAWRIQRTEVCY
jgi:hypothetical protein